MERAGAARLIPDEEMTGSRLFDEVMALYHDRQRLARMGLRARERRKPGAAEAAANVLEKIAVR